jgi:hypothetical protein
VSQIQLMMKCPMQYEWRYCKGEKAPYPVALAEGNAVHRVLQFINNYRMQNKKWLKDKEVADKWAAVWKETQQEVEDWGEESKESVLVRGFDLLRTYTREVMTDTSPVDAERFFDVQFNGQSVIGYMDLVERDCVSDYKVVGRNPSDGDLKNHMQLAMYCLVHKCRTGSLIVFNKKTGRITRMTGNFDPKFWTGWWAEIIERYAKMRKAGVFPPCDASSWCCSEKFCGYYGRCRGAASKKKGVKLVQIQIGGTDPRKEEEED